MDKISFIILTWNSERVIGPCLESIASMEGMDYEIILVDNGSEDGTKEIIEAFEKTHPGIAVEKVLLEKNYGTTISRNLGMKKAAADARYLCILDSDTVISREAMTELIEVLEEDPRNGITGPAMVNLDGVPQVTAKKIPTAEIKFLKAFPSKTLQQKGAEMESCDFSGGQRSYPAGYLISACWMMKREMCEKIGPLDEKIFYSPEDVEYCVRAWQNGYRVLYCPNAHIIHATQRISKKKLLSRHNFEHLKGLLYFFGKYGLFFSSDKIVCK